jgi:hypothetical protein
MRTFGHDIPKLNWLGGKTYPTHFDSRKNRSGHAPEEREARIENGIGALARQELKDRVDAMRPKIEEPAISEQPVLTFTAEPILELPSPPSPEAEILIRDIARELL